MMELVRRVLLGLFLTACGDGGSSMPDARADAFVFVDIDAQVGGGSAELGTGTTAFEAMVDDQELGLVTGPQGGYHFIVHSRIREMDPGDAVRPGLAENPITLFRAFDASGIQIDLMFPPYHIGYEQDDTDPALYVLPSGRILQIDKTAAEIDAFYGSRVRLTLRVSDVEGRVATDERWVVAVPYEGP